MRSDEWPVIRPVKPALLNDAPHLARWLLHGLERLRTRMVPRTCPTEPPREMVGSAIPQEVRIVLLCRTSL